MKRAVVTVGLGFGDEGKGATVDFLVRELDADLVVRYCGGSQAGHNVQLADGRRHTFSQFGAGTLAPQRPRTYLAANVICDPLALRREADHLEHLGVGDASALLTIHPDCLVTTPWLRLLNQLRERARGHGRHGSCGQGIGETRHYWLKHGNDSVFAADLEDQRTLRRKLELQRQRVLLELQNIIARFDAVPDDQDLWNLTTEEVARALHQALLTAVSFQDEVPECDTAIFEGAQGVLLDEYRGFHPHTTWNTVTPHHAWELIEQTGAACAAVLGITRVYTTRHGEGPLPTFSSELTARFADPGNPANPWQGSLRCGWLDLPLLRYAAESAGPLDGLVVNHLDQLAEMPFFIAKCYRNASLSLSELPNLAAQARRAEQLRDAEPILSATAAAALLRELNTIVPVVLRGSGPSHRDRDCDRLSFRRRRTSVNMCLAATE